jgi:hypothetical protein
MDFNSLLKETDIPLLNNDTIPLEERKKNLINYAKMGYLVLNNSKIALNNDDNYIKLLDSKINLIQNDISNYNEKVCVLDKNLDILVGNVKNPSFKGKIGENFLEHALKISFPNDIVDVKAKEGHESDIHFKFNNYLENNVLIESKLYNKPVSTSQIDKFYNDIKRTSSKYALFVSLSSPIVGIQNLQYKYLHNAHIIFIPNCNFNWDTVAYALYFFRILMGTSFNNLDEISAVNEINEKGIIKYNKNVLVEHNKYVKIKDSIYLSENYYKDFLEYINQMISNNYTFWNLITRLRYDINESKNNISKILDNLYKNTYDTELHIRTIIDQTNNKLQYEFKLLNEKFYEKKINILRKKNEPLITNNISTEIGDNKRILYDYMNSKGYIKYSESHINFFLNYIRSKKEKYEPFFAISEVCINSYLSGKDNYNIYGPTIYNSNDDKLDEISEMILVKENINSYIKICEIKFNKTKVDLEKGDIKINLKSVNIEKIKKYFEMFELSSKI